MVDEGADIIDVGGESTRPCSEPISVDEELGRILPVVEATISEMDVLVSIDTCKREVAERALVAGAHIINDISGLTFDPKISSIASSFHAALILMHIKGRPKDMQDHPVYDDLMSEVYSSLRQSIDRALEAGLREDQIIIDPGIGFGKTVEHNLEILKRLEEFTALGYPLLVGVSRKSFIGKILDLPVGDRLEGSLAAAAVGIVHGANILRVHDVKSTVRVARMVDSIIKPDQRHEKSTDEKKVTEWTAVQ
jgi:dihydropteroate synthase